MFARIVIYLFVVLLALPTATGEGLAQNSLPLCRKGIPVKDLDNCIGKWSNGGGSTYEGEFKAGLRNGRGTSIWADGSKYDGTTKDNKFSGQGTYTFSNGDVYSGAWEDDAFNGQGTYKWADGSKYVGQWKDGMPTGKGVHFSAAGTALPLITYSKVPVVAQTYFMGKASAVAYSGAASQLASQPRDSGTAAAQSALASCPTDLPPDKWDNCYGKRSADDGSTYEGEFAEGKMNGQGTLTLGDPQVKGSVYAGGFKNNKFNGQGAYSAADGSKYVGEWKDGLRNGQGTATFPDGRKYVGDFEDDRPNGQGVLTASNGDTYAGRIKDGKRTGPGILNYANGDKFVGEWRDDKFNGQGIHYWQDGTKYVGDYQDNRRYGVFAVTYANGDVFSGEYKDHKRNGNGIYQWKDGSKYIGTWKDGVPSGQGGLTAADGSTIAGAHYRDDGDYGLDMKSQADVLSYSTAPVVTPEPAVAAPLTSPGKNVKVADSTFKNAVLRGLKLFNSTSKDGVAATKTRLEKCYQHADSNAQSPTMDELANCYAVNKELLYQYKLAATGKDEQMAKFYANELDAGEADRAQQIKASLLKRGFDATAQDAIIAFLDNGWASGQKWLDSKTSAQAVACLASGLDPVKCP